MAVLRRDANRRGVGSGGWKAALLVIDKDRPLQHSIIELSEEPQLTADWYRGRPAEIPSEITSLSLALQPALQAPEQQDSSNYFGVQQVQYEEVAPGTPMPGPIGVPQFQFSPQQPGPPLPQPMPIDTPPATGAS